MIYLDPVWYSVLALGFLISFGGYYGGRYYFIVKEGIENLVYDLQLLSEVFEGLNSLTYTNIERRIPLEVEEVYEMGLAMALAKAGKTISPETYPYKLYLVELAGQVFIAVRSIELDLRELIRFMKNYLAGLDSLSLRGIDLTVRVKRKQEVMTHNPLEALILVAGDEIVRRVQGDNTMSAYIMVKDLYRAVNSGNPALMEETLFNLTRKGVAILYSKGASVNYLLRATLDKFRVREHLEVMLKAMG